MNSSGESAAREQSAEALARMFHETYERLAPEFGYKTREKSAVPWEQVPENNKRLMIAVCGAIASHYAARAREVQELVKAVEEDTRQIDRTHRLQLALAPFAAKGETE